MRSVVALGWVKGAACTGACRGHRARYAAAAAARPSKCAAKSQVAVGRAARPRHSIELFGRWCAVRRHVLLQPPSQRRTDLVRLSCHALRDDAHIVCAVKQSEGEAQLCTPHLLALLARHCVAWPARDVPLRPGAAVGEQAGGHGYGHEQAIRALEERRRRPLRPLIEPWRLETRIGSPVAPEACRDALVHASKGVRSVPACCPAANQPARYQRTALQEIEWRDAR